MTSSNSIEATFRTKQVFDETSDKTGVYCLPTFFKYIFDIFIQIEETICDIITGSLESATIT